MRINEITASDAVFPTHTSTPERTCLAPRWLWMQQGWGIYCQAPNTAADPTRAMPHQSVSHGELAAVNHCSDLQWDAVN